MSNDATWPTDGPEFNAWNINLFLFISILEEAKGSGFWTQDFDLKYLTIRVDTRDNGFLLYVDNLDDEKQPIKISPDRVLAAIDKHYTKWGKTARPYQNMLGNNNDQF